MGKAYQRRTIVPRLGELLEEERKEDFRRLLEYYHSHRIAESVLEGDSLRLLEAAHRFAFVISLYLLKLEDIPYFANPYVFELKSDAIQMVASIAIGNKRAFKLFERAAIEDLLRYIYYSHHEIEHDLLQLEPSRYKSIKDLFEYARVHPFFRRDPLAAPSLEVLQSKYSELSREVHASTTSEMVIVNDLISLNRPIENLTFELENLRLISQNIIFMLVLFHREEYSSLSSDEKAAMTSFLSRRQKRALAQLI